MKINTKDTNPAVWFFVPNDPVGGKMKLRVATAGHMKKIRHESNGPLLVEYQQGQRFEYYKPDKVLYDKLLWDYCIPEWENIFNEDGEPMECNCDNRLLIINECIELSNWVGDCLEQLNRDHTILQRQQLKNLKTSQAE